MTHAPTKPITLIMSVVVTCLVAAAGLAATYAVTADRIAEQDRLAQEKSLKAAMPDAASFEQVTDEDALAAAEASAGDVKVNGIFTAFDESGDEMGWGLRVGSRGYGGYAQLVIGLDTSGKVTGVSVLSHAETPGLGTKVMDSVEFLAQFSELPEAFTVADVKAVDSISGATKSSRAVKNGVTAAGAVYADVLSKGGE
ncbi:MAG: RnfABCDGE type electron transport complex subunit G [Actinobacteria bacterium]|nr:RnfABCDGE type electron transport complex subunit G [Actinomycetota bacterium]